MNTSLLMPKVIPTVKACGTLFILKAIWENLASPNYCSHWTSNETNISDSQIFFKSFSYIIRVSYYIAFKKKMRLQNVFVNLLSIT